MANILKARATEYQSADLMRRDCDLQLNLERIELPDQSVDTIVASHVLEHVDDRAALGEIHRCLRPGGTAIIMIPIVEGWKTTYENAAVTAEDERNLHFGQHDHVRYYGADVRDRIRQVGFELEEYSASGENCVKFGLMRGETVFIAVKRMR